MSALLARQRGKRHSTVAIVAKFDRVRVRLPGTLFLALEALLDRAVYFEPTDKIINPVRLTPLLCEGKSGVLAVLNHIKSHHPTEENILFFIDRDYDDFLGTTPLADRRLYVTDGYSIENFFTSQDALRCILNHVLCVEDDDESDLVGTYAAQFEKASDAFRRKISLLMSWTISIRQLGGKVNLGNVSLSAVFTLGADGFPARKAQALKTFIERSQVDMSLRNRFSIRENLRRLLHIPLNQAVRGKFALWFFVRFVDLVKDDLRKRHERHERAEFIDAHIDAENIVQLLNGRLAPPASLTSFLTSAAARYVRA